MSDEDVSLIKPTPALKAEFLEFAAEFRAEGDDRFEQAIEDFDGFLRHLEDYALGRDLPHDHIAQTSLWLVRNGRTVLGVTNVRHGLTPALWIEGGHIGYSVRPSQRRKGYGTRLLALALDEARKMGMTRVLVTCDTDNVASARVIQKNGGVYENEGTSPRSGKPVSRYWIDLETVDRPCARDDRGCM